MQDYLVYRTNFVLMWILVNLAYAIPILVIDETSDSAEPGEVHDSDSGPLVVFSLYMASLAVLRFFLAAIYLIMWKFRYNCSKQYKIKRVDLKEELEKIKNSTHEHGDSSDEAITIKQHEQLQITSPQSA